MRYGIQQARSRWLCNDPTKFELCACAAFACNYECARTVAQQKDHAQLRRTLSYSATRNQKCGAHRVCVCVHEVSTTRELVHTHTCAHTQTSRSKRCYLTARAHGWCDEYFARLVICSLVLRCLSAAHGCEKNLINMIFNYFIHKIVVIMPLC